MIQSVALTLAPLLTSFAIASQPGAMYETIKKPDWTPPPIAFPIVWTVLYLSMGYASTRVADATGSLWSIPMIVYWIQLALNISWTPVFFGKGKYATALTILRVLLAAVLVTAVLFWQVDTTSGLLLVPYIAWLFVAHALNWWIVDNNPDQTTS